MFIDMNVGKYIANDKDNRFILEADGTIFRVWFDTVKKIYICKNKQIKTEREMFYEVDPTWEIKKSDFDNWSFPSKDHEGAFEVATRGCVVNGEYTASDGVVYIKFYRFKHVYDIHAYVRSCSLNDENIEKQKKIIEEYCNKYLPYSSISWHIDNGCSGLSSFFLRNAAFDMYNSLSDKESHVVIVSDMSRISRNIEATCRAIEELINENCRFISIREEVDFV